MQLRYPSVKTIGNKLAVPRDVAKTVRALMDGTMPADTVPETAAWIRRCYNRPSGHELTMHAIAATLAPYGFHDCEAVFADGATWPRLEYVNTGEMYAATVCRFDGRYRVACVGDIVETHNL